MSEQGAPEVVILDNGPRYDCHWVKNHIPDRDKIAQRLTERQQSMKLYYDRNGHDLSPLSTGQPVRIQDQATKNEPRSYEVKTQPGSLLRRNRRPLRPANTGQVVISSEDEPVEPSPDVPESTKASHNVVSSPTRDVCVTSGPPSASKNLGTYRTSSGRAVIRPTRFTE